MKRLLPCLLVVLAVSGVEAKRAYRRPVNAPTGVKADDGRLAAWGKGFLVCRDVEGKPQIFAYDADGKNPKALVKAAAKIDAWRASPMETSIAWISGGHLHVTGTAEGADRDLGEADAALPAFSPDEKVVAFLSKGKLVLRDLSGDRRREISPREGRTIGTFGFSGNGKWVMAVTSQAATSAIELADASAEAPSLSILHEPKDARISDAAASPVNDLVAFVEKRADGSAGTLRIVELGTGQFHDFTAIGDFRDLSWTPGGLDLLLSTAGKDGARLIGSQRLTRSGTKQGFWRETLSVEGAWQDRFPVVGKGETWLLRFQLDGSGPAEVVRASLE